MAPRPRREDPEDDGRTIVNMNVEGMPWYDRAAAERQQQEESGGPHYQMTKEEQRMYTWAAVKTGLLVVLIFASVFGAFIAFCDFIWFQ